MSTVKEFIGYKLSSMERAKGICKLIQTIHNKGTRLTLLCADPATMEGLDNMLWSFEQLSFIPHLRYDEPNAEQTPIVISPNPTNINKSEALVLFDIKLDTINVAFDKIICMYEGNNEEQTHQYELLLEKLKSSNININQYAQNSTGSWDKI